MKKIFQAGIILLLVTGAYAQKISLENEPQQKDTIENKKTIKYCCIKGNYSDMKPGQCPIDNSTLIPEGIYYCKVCNASSYRAGKCPKCANDMVKMECPEMVIKQNTKPAETKSRRIE